MRPSARPRRFPEEAEVANFAQPERGRREVSMFGLGVSVEREQRVDGARRREQVVVVEAEREHGAAILREAFRSVATNGTDERTGRATPPRPFERDPAR